MTVDTPNVTSVAVLYRTPNIIIDRHEWHATVRKSHGRVALQYFFRPLSPNMQSWRPITAWEGRKPKGLGSFFQNYRRHIAVAMESETLRQFAIAKLRNAA